MTTPVDHIEVFQLVDCDDVSTIRFETDEFTSMCPVTGQPDLSKLIIEYKPNDYAIESKSLKLWLWQFRNEGHFAEALANIILDEVSIQAKTAYARVEVHQRPRGGIALTVIADTTE